MNSNAEEVSDRTSLLNLKCNQVHNYSNNNYDYYHFSKHT